MKQSKLSDGVQLTIENVFGEFDKKFPSSGKMPKPKRVDQDSQTDKGSKGGGEASLDDASICLQVIESQWSKLVASEAGRKGLLRLSPKPLIAILKSDNLCLNEGGEFFLYLLAGAWAERKVFIETQKKLKQEKRKGIP